MTLPSGGFFFYPHSPYLRGIINHKSIKMKKLIFLFGLACIVLSCDTKPLDTALLSGSMNESDQKTKIVRKLAQAYRNGTFEEAKEYFTSDGVHYVNNVKYTTDEIIEGYNFHSVLYDDIKHIDPTVTTMYYNNGDVYTNQWSDWSGKSKITGEVYENSFHCCWKWEGNKIVSTKCYLDLTDIMKEAALYQEKMSQ